LLKRFWCVVFLLAFVITFPLPVYSGKICSKDPQMPKLGGKTRAHLIYSGAHIEIKSNTDGKESYEWVDAIREATILFKLAGNKILPQIFIPGKYSFLKIIIGEDRTKWYSSLYIHNQYAVFFNTVPCSDHPYGFEYFSEDGFIRNEKLYVVIHEFAHAYDFQIRDQTGVMANRDLLLQIKYVKEGYFSKHSVYNGTYSPEEDFAESFVFYILYPSYLKANRPLRYQLIKKILGIEYTDLDEIPSSVIARIIKEP
jgi:hypothetical protein